MSRRNWPLLIPGIALCLTACSAGTTVQPNGTPPPQSAPSASAPPAAHTIVATVVIPTAEFTPQATLEPTFTAASTVSPVVSLMAVGDIMLARTIGAKVQAEGPQAIFAGVREVLMSADVLVGNLECTLSTNGQPEPKAYTFAAPGEAASSLSSVGFDVISQANNHSLDYGPSALAETRQLLDTEGIRVVGAGPNESAAHAPVTVERNGLRIAFVAYVDVPVESGGFDTRNWIAVGDQPGVAWADPSRIQAEVAGAKSGADLVVVLLHFGWEERANPSPEQIVAAHAAIDGGASLVIGAHPHLLQESEWYNGGLIVYSLGNFVFDGFGLPANFTAILSATLTRDGVAGIQWIPVVIEGGLPRLANEDESALILRMVNK